MHEQPTPDEYTNQAAAELAFAKSMGWDDWTWDEETEEGMVRGYRVQWKPDPRPRRGRRSAPNGLRVLPGRDSPGADGERGWRAYLTTDENELAEAVISCPDQSVDRSRWEARMVSV